MKCPLCHNHILFFKNPMFVILLYLKQVAACPYCNVAIYKKTNKIWKYYEQFLFIFFWFGVLLSLLAIIFGRQIGFKSAFIICFWFWIILAIVFLAIIFLNLVYILLRKI